MTKKWLNKWQKNDTTKQEWQKNAKPNDKKMTKINNQQPSEFAGKIFIMLFLSHLIPGTPSQLVPALTVVLHRVGSLCSWIPHSLLQGRELPFSKHGILPSRHPLATFNIINESSTSWSFMIFHDLSWSLIIHDLSWSDVPPSWLPCNSLPVPATRLAEPDDPSGAIASAKTVPQGAVQKQFRMLNEPWNQNTFPFSILFPSFPHEITQRGSTFHHPASRLGQTTSIFICRHDWPWQFRDVRWSMINSWKLQLPDHQTQECQCSKIQVTSKSFGGKRRLLRLEIHWLFLPPAQQCFNSLWFSHYNQKFGGNMWEFIWIHLELAFNAFQVVSLACWGQAWHQVHGARWEVQAILTPASGPWTIINRLNNPFISIIYPFIHPFTPSVQFEANSQARPRICLQERFPAQLRGLTARPDGSSVDLPSKSFQKWIPHRKS